MDVFLRIDINISAMILLATVFIIAFNRLDKHDVINRKFLITSWLVLTELFVETLTCIINRQPERQLIPVTYMSHILLFSIAPMITYYWFSFIHRWITPNKSISHKKQVALLIPVIINVFVTALSPIYGCVFYIDSNNVYHRGHFFAVTAAVTFLYLIYSFVTIIRHRRSFIRSEFLPLISFGVFPAIGGILQSILYGTLLMWSFSAFSLIVLYIYLQLRMVQMDCLTGAWTRESYEHYIQQKFKRRNDFDFGAIFIDLDDLKNINDKFGHQEGDFAIKTLVHLIKGTLKKTDLIARLGGDEFIVIVENTTKEKLEKIINKIKYKLNQYNMKSGKSYLLDCSFGADICNSDFNNLEQFLKHLDNLMYYNKRSKK